MATNETESLLYGGESPENVSAFQRYLLDVQRGKSLLQLKAVADDLTPQLRQWWSPRSFTPVQTSEGVFDEVVCNVSYHFYKHGQKYRTVRLMTEAALRFFREHRQEASVRQRDGLLQFPDGSLFEVDGRIVTFVS
jgi:hypothetical protein